MLLELCKNYKLCKVHFIGIGGISMSALAMYLNFRGFSVSGSDACETEITDKLKKSGISVNGGMQFLSGADIIVISSAIGEDNAELMAARSLNKSVMTRADMLKEVAACFKFTVGIAGTHGKTTCAAMTAHIFDAAGFPYTAHIGGEDDELGNLSVKGDKYFITEVCEYKKNIAKITPHVGIVLNVAADHMDSYGTMSALVSEFYAYIGRSGVSIVNADDKLLSESGANVSFSIVNANAEYFADSIKHKNGKLFFKVYERGRFLFSIKLDNCFMHNVYNALAATAAARVCGIAIKPIKQGLLAFKGVRRRAEKIGLINGAAVIADYAHHPEQIQKTIAELKQRCKGSLFIVFQPHTYSRTRLLINEFIAALKDEDELFIYKTYAAREKYDYFGSAENLCANIPSSRYFEDAEAMFTEIKSKINKNDMLVVLGAGDIYFLAKEFVD